MKLTVLLAQGYLGRYAEAEKIHSAAAKDAKRMGDGKQQENSLNNLGEALRHLDRCKESIKALRESEKVARIAERYESAISTAHNRALAHESLGELKESQRLLQKCRVEAAHHEIWAEYARAWEGLANLTWAMGKPAKAWPMYQRAQREARKHNVRDVQPRIALNCARLERARGQPKAAIRTLEQFRAGFDRFADSYQYFGTLAELYTDVGRMRDAATAWDAAKLRAIQVDNAEYASFCASKQSHVLAKLGRQKLSQAAIQGALDYEHDPARRANLLIQQLELLVKQKSKLVQKALDDVLQFCAEHKLFEQKSEVYLLVGDHDLSGTYRKKLNALKAYVMAMMSSIEGGISASESVASHILLKIASPDSPVEEDELGRLLIELNIFLASKIPEGAGAVRFLIWPIHFAAELMPYRKQPRRFLSALQKVVRSGRIPKYLNAVDKKSHSHPAAANGQS